MTKTNILDKKPHTAPFGAVSGSFLSYRFKLLVGLFSVLVIACGQVNGQTNGRVDGYFSGISKVEIELLISDLAKSNPTVPELLAKDPEMRKSQIDNLRELFALASQAQRDGLASEQINRQELESIRNEILAVNFDREINKGKAIRPPFGYIVDRQVTAFWNGNSRHEAEFNAYLDAKLELLLANGPERKYRPITADERSQARDVFAKTRIYSSEYETKAKAGLLPKVFIDKANLQVKLQQAQFLARLAMQVMFAKIGAADTEIDKYIAEHPELDPRGKKAKAQSILNRAKSGEDFAALANEFSEDPGNTGQDGKKQGGIYKDIPKGRMVAPFEKAALAVNAGQISPEVVETDFGFHIIKLEKKGLSKDRATLGTEIYDARHILIGTSIEDPENPEARPLPVKDYVRKKIESEREKQYIDRIVAENNIKVPADFDVPKLGAVVEPKVVKKPVSKKRPVKKRK